MQIESELQEMQQERMAELARQQQQRSSVSQKREGFRGGNKNFVGRQLMKLSRDLYNVIEEQTPNSQASKLIRVTIGNGDEFLKHLDANEFDKVLLSSLNALIKVAQCQNRVEAIEPPFKEL